MNEGSAINLSLGGAFFDPEGDPISLSVTGLPGWATFNAGSNSITGTPGAGAVNQTHTVNVNASATGGGAFDSFTLTINDRPDLTAGGGGNAIFSAGGGGVGLDPALALADAEGNFNGGTLRVALSAPAAGSNTLGGSNDDTLAVAPQTVDGLVVALSGSDITVDGVVIGTISATSDGTQDTTVGTDTTGKVLSITFNGNATTARVQATLRSLQFENSAGTVATENRTIDITLTDANGAEETFSTTVEAYNNQRPDSVDVTLNVNEDATLTLAPGNFAFTDGDGGDSLQAVKITELPSSSEGALKLSGTDITPGDEISLADITAGNLTFVPAADFNGTVTFKFTVGDGKQFGLDANANTATVTVAPVDDAPRGTASSRRTYPVTTARAILIDPGLALIDVDAADNSDTGTYADNGTGYLQIDITANRVAGDTLSIANQGTGAGQIGVDGTTIRYENVVIGTIDGTLDGTSNTALKINLNGSASNDAVQALARATTIRSGGTDHTGSTEKTVSFFASDGENVGTATTRTVDLNGLIVDDFSSHAGLRTVLSFDGSNDRVTLGNANSLTGDDDPLSLETWINTSDTSGRQALISFGEVQTATVLNTDFSSTSGLSLSGDAQIFDGRLRLTVDPDLTDNDDGNGNDNTSTTGQISVGSVARGSIDNDGDVDWIRVILLEGRDYEIRILGEDSGGGRTLGDPDLEGIYDYDGNALSGYGGDSGGTGDDAVHDFTAPYSGEFYIAVYADNSYSDEKTGTFDLSVVLTDGSANQAGLAQIDPPSDLQGATYFDASFMLYSDDSGNAVGDGFSFGYGVASTLDLAEDPLSSGLSITFDTYENTDVSGDEEGIEVWFDGSRIGSANTSIDFTDASGVSVEVTYDHDGLTVRVGGSNIITNHTISAYESANKSSYDYILAGRSGSNNATQEVDGLTITATNPSSTAGQLVVEDGELKYVQIDHAGETVYAAGETAGADSVADGAWHHVAATHDGNNTLKLYVDGHLANTFTGVSKDVVTGSVRVGSNENANGDFFTGLMDDIRIWNEARSETEIAAEYLPDLSNPTEESTLVGYWRAEDVSGSSIGDGSSNSNNGSVSGAVTTTSSLYTSPNGTDWTVVEGSDGTSRSNDVAYIDTETGELVIQNRELVRSADQLTPSGGGPVHVTGIFTFTSGSDGFMHVLTRSDPSSTDSFGFPANGLNFSAVEGDDRILIDRFVGGTLSASVANSGNGSIDLRKDTEYSFEVFDDGTNVRMTVTEVGDSANTATVTATDTTDFSGDNYVILTNRQDTNSGGEQVIRFDDVTIDQDHVIAEDATLSGTLPSTGLTGPFTFAVLDGAEHGTFTITDASAGTYTYSPTSGYHGRDTFSFQVTDTDGAINVQTVAVDVKADLDVQVAGKHLSFDGSNDFIQVTDADNLDFAAGDSFTLETWINLNDVTTTQSLIDKAPFADGASNTDTSNYRFFVDNGELKFWDTTADVTTSGAGLTVGEWTHVAVTYDADAELMTFYQNGEVAGIADASAFAGAVNTGPLLIGRDNQGRFVNGEMDEVRIWSEARTADDIRLNYDQQLGTADTLEAYYRFDDIQLGVVTDKSGNGNHGALGDDLTVGDDAEPTVADGARGKVLTLDGSDDYVRFTDTYETTTSFTVETWAWSDPDDTGGHVFSKDQSVGSGGDTAGAANWEIGHGRIVYEKNNDPGQNFSIDPGLEAGTWNHYALAVDDQGDGTSTVSIYVNGTLIHSETVNTVTVTGGGFLIGRRGFANDGNFQGQLDDYRVWNTARTADDIAENYQKTLSGNQGGALIAHLTFDDDTGSVTDLISSNTGSLNGGATIEDGAAAGKLPSVYGSVVELAENSSASGYMITNDALDGTVSYAIADTDNGNDPVTSFTTDTGATVTIDAGTGNWTYTPLTNYSGSDSFTLLANGSTSGTDSETVTVTVAGGGDEQSVDVSDGALQLDGTGDYVNLGSNPQLAFGSGAFTVEGWVRTSKTDNTRMNILDLGNTTTDNQGAFLFIEDGKLKFDSFNSADVVSTSDVNDQEWHHVSVTRDGTTVSLYVDGILETTGTLSFTVPQATSSIGLQFFGEMDEFRFWEDARTADEIAANYDKQVATDADNLTAYYRFDDTVADGEVTNSATATGSALDATLVGDATTFDVPASAARFDGTDDYIEVANPTGDVVPGTSSFTYEAWVRTEHGSRQTVMGIGGGGDGSMTMRISADGTVQINNSDHGAGAGEVFGTSSVNDGLWHHIAVSYDSGTGLATIYVDGQAEVIGDAKSFNIATANLVVGEAVDHSGNPFVGDMANVRFWTTARTDQEVAVNYNRILKGDETGLATQYLFDEAVSGQMTDSAGTNDATISGSVTVIDPSPTVQGTVADIAEGQTLSGQMTGNDVQGTPSYELSGAGTADDDGRVTATTDKGGTVILDTSSGQWTYTPADNWYGEDSFTLTANGDASTSDTETVTVNVRDQAHSSVVTVDGQLLLDGDYANGSLGTNTITNAMTVEFKLNLAALPGAEQSLITLYDTTGNNARYVPAVKNTGEIYFYVNDGTSSDTVDTGIILSTDTWYDVAVAYDGTTAKVYLDGQLIGDEDISGMAMTNTSQAIKIGTRWDDNGNPTHGSFDEVKVWSEARTAEQIRDGIDQPIASGTTNLEAYYKFDDEVTPGTVQDHSGNDRDLTLTGDAKVVNNLDTAISFDAGDHIEIGAGTGNELRIDGDITTEVWVKPESIGAEQSLIAISGPNGDDNDADQYLFGLEIDGTGNIVALHEGTGGTEVRVTTDTALTAGEWAHVAVSRNTDSHTYKIFINGELATVGTYTTGEAPLSAATTTNAGLRLGTQFESDGTTLSKPFTGEMADVRIWNTTRTDEEVLENYAREIVGDEGGALVAHYEFKEASGQTVTDSAGDNDGTLGADNTTATDDPTRIGDNGATGNALAIQEDEAASGRLLANDMPGTPTFTLSTDGSHGTVDLATDGTWSYTPVANYHGTDSFTFEITSTDADGSTFTDTETVNVTINSVDDGNALQLSDGAVELNGHSDGANDYVDIPDTVLNNTEGTVSLRFNLDANAPTNETQYLFANVDSDGDRVYIAAEYDTDASAWRIAGTLDDNADTITGTTVQTGSWYEATLVWRTDGTGELFLDGNSQGTISGIAMDAGASGVNADVSIGTYDENDNGQFASALIDEVSIWSTAQADADIRARVGQQLAGDEADLTAYYRFDDDANGNVVRDLTGNGNDGTLTNGATITDPPTNPTVLGNEIEIQSSETAGGTMTGADIPGTATYAVTDTDVSAAGSATSLSTAKGGIVNLDGNTGAWTYTPAAGYYGADSFTLWAKSTSGGTAFEDDETITVTIKSDNNVNVADGVLQVEGTDDWALVGDADALDITGNLTLEAWIKPNGPGSHASVGGVIAGKENAYLLAREPDGDIIVALNGPNGVWTWNNFNYKVAEGVDTHLAMTFDGSAQEVKLYADGELVSTITDNGNIPTAITSGAEAFAIGGRPAQDEEFEGLIDDVRVWNDLRSADEIRENHDQKLTGSEDGLVGYWNFDDTDGTTVQDGTSNDNDAALVSDARVINTNGPAMSFDNDGDVIELNGLKATDTSFSWEFWAYRDSTNDYDLALTSDDNTGGNAHFFHAGYLGSSFRYSFNQSSGTYRIDYSDTTGPNGDGTEVWNHWAGTYDKDTNVAKLFLNGTVVAIEQFDGPLLSTADFFVGGIDPNVSTDYEFGGKLDEVRLWDGARTEEQIAENYNKVLTGDQSGALLANYSFDATSGDAVNKADPGTFDGTVTGANRIDESPAFYGDTIEIEENETVQGVMSNTGADGSATFSAGTPSNGGSVTVDTQTGRWTYTPAENYNGEETFTLTATGAQGHTDTETITVTINPDAANISPITNGEVLTLDGTNDYFSAANNAPLDISGAFTLETWINLADASPLQNIIDKFGDGGVNYRIFVDQGHIGVFSIDAGTVKTDDGIVQSGEWTHIAASFDGTDVTFYVNGERVSDPQAFSHDGANSGAVTIGRDDLGRYVDGMIDDVRIWSDARTAGEIRDNYDQLVTSNADNLAANWVFDGSDGTTVTDRSSNNNDGTLTGGAATQHIPDKAIEFDGTVDYVEVPYDTVNNMSTGTIETWVYLDSVDSETIFTKQHDGLNTFAALSLGHTVNGSGGHVDGTDGKLYFKNANAGNTIESATTLETGKWYHVAVTFSTTEAKLFINGIEDAQSSADFSIPSDTSDGANTSARIGDWKSNAYGLDGKVADFRVWNTVRTTDEIADNFDASMTGSESGLIANYTMTETITNGTQVEDTTSSDNHGTLNGNAALVDTTPDIFATSVAIREDSIAQGTFEPNDVVPDSAVYGVSASNAHTGDTSVTVTGKGTVTMDSTTGAWTFTPVESFNGTAQFYLTAQGGGETDVEQFTVTVLDNGSLDVSGAFAQIDGSSTVFTADHSTDLNVSTDGLTFETWVQINNGSAWDGIVDKLHSGGQRGWKVGLDAEGDNIAFHVGNVSSTFKSVSHSTNVNDGAWHHVAAVYDAQAGTIELYVDGTATGSPVDISPITQAEIASDTSTLVIGKDTFSDDRWLDGQLDDIRVWSKPRSAEEITSNFDKQLNGDEADLVANWDFSDVTDNTVQDKTGNDHDLTITGGEGAPSIVTSQGSALSLDGSANEGVTVAHDASYSGTAGTWVVNFKTDGTWDTDGDDTNNKALLIGQHDAGASNNSVNGLTVTVGTGGLLQVEAKDGAVSALGKLEHASGSVTDNNWHQLAVTFDQAAGTLALWLDGAKVDQLTGLAAWNFASNDLHVGESGDAFWEEFAGLISDVRIYDEILSDSELSQGLSGSLPDNDGNLKLHLNFDAIESTTVTDISGNGNDGATTGTPAIVDTAPVIEGNAITVAKDGQFIGTMTDADVTGTASFAIADSPSHGTIILDSESGEWRYTPNSGFVGTDGFTLRATGATSGTDNEVIAVTVSAGADDAQLPTTSFLQLDGIDDYVDLGTPSENLSGAFAFEAWINIAEGTLDNNTWMRIVEYGNGPESDNLLLAIDPGSDQLSFDIRDGSTVTAVKADFSMPEGEWMHVAGVNDGETNGTSYLYVNGELIATAGSQEVANNQVRSQNYLGQSNWDNETQFQGGITEVRVWNAFRSAEEIKANYDKSLTGSESGLHSYYTFDDVAGGIAADRTGNGNDGTVFSDTFDRNTAGHGPTGDVLSLDGTGDYVEVPMETVNALTAGTMEAWIYLDSVTGETIFSKQNDGDNSHAMLTVGYTTDSGGSAISGDPGKVYFRGFNAGGSLASTDTLDTGKWHHVAVSFTGTEAKLYIDGNLDKTQSGDFQILDDTDNDAGTSARIGSLKNSSTYDLDGKVDNFRVWSSERSAEEIREGMTQSYDYDTSDLVTQYAFEDLKDGDSNGSLETVRDGAFTMTDGDRDANATDGTLTGDATVVDSGVGGARIISHLDQAIRFDGTGDTATGATDLLPEGNAARTIMLWAKTSSDGPQTLASYGDTGDGQNFRFGLNGWDVDSTNDGGKGVTVDVGSGAITFQPLTATDDGQWHHYAVVLPQDGSIHDLKVYQDGVLLTAVSANFNNANSTISTTHHAPNPFKLGSYDGGTYFEGDMAEASVWSRALLSTEVQQYMSEPLSGSETNLAAYWRGADNGSGNAQDFRTGGDLDLTLNGNAQIVDATPTIHSNAIRVTEDNIATGRMTGDDVSGTASYSVQSAAGNGTVTIDSTTGVWNYVPTNGYAGADTFTLRASGDNSTVDDEVISVTVGNDPVAPGTHAMSFDGVNDYIDAGELAEPVTGSFTVEAWVNFDRFHDPSDDSSGSPDAGWMRIFDFGDGSGSGNSNGFLLTASGTTGELALHTYNGGATLVAADDSLPTNEWTHVAAVNDAGTVTLYVNGSVVKTATGQNTPGTISGAANNYIGKSNDDSDNYFDGRIADARVWNDARTDDEIADNYERQLNGDEEGLALYYNFDEGNGSIVTDKSGNGNDGVISGATREDMTTIDMTSSTTYKGLILGADADRDNLNYSVETGDGLDNGGSFTIDADGSFEYDKTGNNDSDDEVIVTITDDDNNTTTHALTFDV